MKTRIFRSWALALACAAALPPARAQNGETDPAPGYTAPPPIVNIGGNATVAAYSPPHEQIENPADDTDDINESRTREAFTRPIYVTPDNLNPAGNPIRPLPTTDWWTSVLMSGDGGTLWQYPITSKFIAAGIELQHILGPGSTSPGTPATGFATGGVLRVEALEKPNTSGLPDYPLPGSDFEGNGPSLPAGWTISTIPGATGVVLITNPVKNVAETPGLDPTGFSGERFLITKNINPDNSNTPRGMVTSPAFTVDRGYLHYQIGGQANTAELRVELIDSAGTVLDSQMRGTTPTSNTTTLIWQRFDLTGRTGQSLRIRVVDNSTGAWIVVDQMLLSNEPLSPVTRPGSRLISGGALVRDWSDWMVKVRKTDSINPNMTMDVSLARNMPFAWVQLANANPRVSFDVAPVIRNAAGTTLSSGDLGIHEKLSVEVSGRFYGLHAPAGTSFAYDSTTRRLTAFLPDTAGSDYLVVSAMLAANQLATLDTYAYARPEKTTVTYAYDPARPTGGAVQSNWSYQITSLKPGANKVLQGWLPPHYRDTGANLGFVAGLEYATPRGLLRCGEAVASTGFTINYGFNGILGNFATPTVRNLPDGFDPAYMETLLRDYDRTNNGVCDDTYFGAKNLVKHGRAMHMAKELGLTDVYENLKAELKASLTDWFTYDGTEQNHYFAHNDRWGHIIGHNFVPDFNLAGFTDVHFHYGYYTLAYALLAQEDEAFRDQFKDIAVELARAYANWEHPTTMRNAQNQMQYPWMRTFEPMVGHSYAGGSGGNNQESSSESIQAWAGMFLLGEVLRGNDPRAADIQATAAFGYAIETRAVYEYYCDYHGSPFSAKPLDRNGQPAVGNLRYGNWPDSFRYGKYASEYPDHPAWIFTNGIMSDNGNSFANYFSGEPAHTYGIQWLPNAPHMMFLARDPDFIRGQFNTLFKYRGDHYAIGSLNPLRTSMQNSRNKWYSAPTADDPDQRVVAINEGWPTYGIKWAIQTVYELNPAYARQTANNPLYRNGQWLVTFPATDTFGAQVTFPAAIWTPDALIADNPHLVPPANSADLPNYSLVQWIAGMHTAGGGPGPDWARYKAAYSWDPADYSSRDSAASITGLLKSMQDIGGNSWPLIALCYDGFAEPEFALKVIAEYRRRNLSFATDTESNMFFYNYLTSLQGLGTIQTDQHLGIGTSAVFKTAGGERNYMVQNMSASYRLVDVFEGGAVIGQVLAYPKTTTLQKGLLEATEDFAPIGTVPENNATNVSVNQDKIAVIFSEPFNPATLDTEVTISGPGGLTLQYLASPSPQIAEYRIVGNWTLGATYTIHVPATVANATNTSTVGTARQFSFTIQGPFGFDITGTTPATAATGVDPGLDTIEVTFNSRVNPATLGAVTLAGAGNPALTYNSSASTPRKAVFNIGSDLQPGGSYTLTIPGSVADVYGQTLSTAETFTFITRQADTVLASWPTTLDWSKFTQVASSGEATSTVSGARIWAFDAVGDFVTLRIAAEQAGIYNLMVTYRQNPGRGIVKLVLNGTDVPNKLLDETLGITPAGFDFGNITLNAGDNLLRFEVVTKKGTAAPQFSLINATFTPVQIFPVASGYAAYQQENFGPGQPANSGAQDDYDKDGVVNFLEFAFGTPPKSGTQARYPLVTRNTSTGMVTVAYPKAGADLHYQVRRSSNLIDWSPVPMAGESFNPGTGLYETTVEWPAPVSQPLFISIEVTE
ncbi:glycosyl hydrolase [Luteolibacter soli]|uniref:glucan endo-1,3-beta-D-glucosidase n=1 Tax=Luteolibacter soli TaxID=3135280 RepID=A0ABU9AUK6_9BACT